MHARKFRRWRRENGCPFGELMGSWIEIHQTYGFRTSGTCWHRSISESSMRYMGCNWCLVRVLFLFHWNHRTLPDISESFYFFRLIFARYVLITFLSPFDQRCMCLHDPRIAGLHSCLWLPHAETLINGLGSSVNVDKLYHQRLASVYTCCPIYGYVPV